MTIHKLKTWPEYFALTQALIKPFEIRKNDRDFKVGDTVILQCFDPVSRTYTGEDLTFKINYILPGGQFGLAPDYVVMALI